MNGLPELKSFPTIRAEVGDWSYYITTLPFYEVARRIRSASEIVLSPSLNNWIQRAVMPRRKKEIAEYLINQPEHFFNAVVVGVYGGEPLWYGIEVGENNLFDTPSLDPRFENALGIMELSGEEKLYAIDGQHRIAGIVEALDQLRRLDSRDAYAELANEDLTLVFVAADMDAGHLQRVRRMFSTLNKRAKPVSKAELIALDEDDPGPIITRRLVTEYEPFSAVSPGNRPGQEYRFVHLGKTNQISPSNRWSFTTIVTLLDVTQSMFGREIKNLARENHMSRPPESDLDKLFNDNVEVWEAFHNAIPEAHRIFESRPMDMLAGEYRHDNGGHLLFRPIGQQAFADALGVLRGRGYSIDTSIEHLAQAPMQLAEPPWRHVLWDPNTKRMVNAYRAVAANLFLHMVGQPPKSRPADFQKRFRELYVDEEDVTLESLPISAVR